MATFMMNYFDKLPEDLQDNIYSLIKYPQDKDLILDIKTFHIVKKTIYSNYLRNWIDSDYNLRYNIHWQISKDLSVFLNGNTYNIDETNKINEKRMNRTLSYRIKYNLYNEKASFNFNKITFPKTYINKYIGCLNVDERGELLSHFNELFEPDY